MNKKKILIIWTLIITISMVLYVLLGTINVKSKMDRYLTDKGDTASKIESVKVRHSFMNLLLSYDEWGIEVRYYDEPDVIYYYKYKNKEIAPAGVSGKGAEKSELKNLDDAYLDTEIKGIGKKYVAEGELPSMLILQNNNEYVLYGPAYISFIPSGKYREENNKLFLDMSSEEIIFSIEKNSLIFESGIWLENWVEKGSKFHLINE